MTTASQRWSSTTWLRNRRSPVSRYRRAPPRRGRFGGERRAGPQRRRVGHDAVVPDAGAAYASCSGARDHLRGTTTPAWAGWPRADARVGAWRERSHPAADRARSRPPGARRARPRPAGADRAGSRICPSRSARAGRPAGARPARSRSAVAAARRPAGRRRSQAGGGCARYSNVTPVEATPGRGRRSPRRRCRSGRRRGSCCGRSPRRRPAAPAQLLGRDERALLVGRAGRSRSRTSSRRHRHRRHRDRHGPAGR